MAGFRADLRKLALDDDSDDDEDERRRVKLEKLRGQHGAATWKTTTEATPEQRKYGEVAAVDTTAHGAYGTRMEKASAYEGPKISTTIETVVAEYAKPELLPNRELTAASLLAEVNLVRTKPKAYVKTLEKFRGFYEDLTRHSPRDSTDRVTAEGLRALDEAIAFLKKAEAVPALKTIGGLTKAAEARRGASEFGKVEGISFDLVARNTAPDEVVVDLLICDGDAVRKTRRQLLNDNITRAGAAVSKDDCVLVCAQTFREYPLAGTASYHGKIPVQDETFLEMLLALPDPLPKDLLSRIKLGHLVAIDFHPSSKTRITINNDEIIDVVLTSLDDPPPSSSA